MYKKGSHDGGSKLITNDLLNKVNY